MLMKKVIVTGYTCLSLLLSGLEAQAQPYDLQVDEFIPVVQQRKAIEGLSARSMVYCDGENVSMVVKVIDPVVRVHQENRFTDHINIWLALPESVYPQNFEYQFHPNYIATLGKNRDDFGETRYFSAYADYSPQLNREFFIEKSDYPPIEKLKVDSLSVPPEYQLGEMQLPYGLVGFSLYPDNRPAVWINKEQMAPLEEMLELKIASLADSIKYVAQYTDHEPGYILDVQFSPATLGFVQLPEMKKLRILIEIVDVPRTGGEAKPVLSSSPYRRPYTPYTFNEVEFHRPLQTNQTDIPNELFYMTGFRPTFIFGEYDFVSTSVDVDALVYRPKFSSQYLTEIKFYRQLLDYQSDIFEGFVVETLKVQQDYVNKSPTQKEFTFVNNHVLVSNNAPYVISTPEALSEGLFLFPDNTLGMIQKNSYSVDPYLWNDCNECVEENVAVIRMTEYGEQKIMEFRQYKGDITYFQLGEYYLENFYVSSIDWIRKGEVMVINLNHISSKQSQRLKITWADDGSKLKIKQVD
jgi:hypothetical protein